MVVLKSQFSFLSFSCMFVPDSQLSCQESFQLPTRFPPRGDEPQGAAG